MDSAAARPTTEGAGSRRRSSSQYPAESIDALSDPAVPRGAEGRGRAGDVESSSARRADRPGRVRRGLPGLGYAARSRGRAELLPAERSSGESCSVRNHPRRPIARPGAASERRHHLRRRADCRSDRPVDGVRSRPHPRANHRRTKVVSAAEAVASVSSSVARFGGAWRRPAASGYQGAQRDASRRRPHRADGLRHWQRAHDDASSDLAGTPLYLAPEVLQGQSAPFGAISTVSASCSITSSRARIQCTHAPCARFAVRTSAASGPLFRPRGPMCHRSSPASSSARSITVPSAATKALMLSQGTWRRCSLVRDW